MALSIKEVLMKRDGLTEKQVDEQITELVEHFNDYLDDGDAEGAYNVMEEVGLESDYVYELMY